eukprot:2463157-Pyramimonas_sp.AAC.1
MASESEKREAVPSWDGDGAGFDSYILRVKLYVRGAKEGEEGFCGPSLMSKLQGRAWQGAQ